VHRAIVNLLSHDWSGRVRAHAAGVRAFVAVAKALVVLRRGERQHVAPSTSAMKLASSPSRNSSTTMVLPAHRSGPQTCLRRRDRSSTVAQITIPAGREPVRLHDQRRALRAHQDASKLCCVNVA